MLDHAAKPPVAAGGWQPWADADLRPGRDGERQSAKLSGSGDRGGLGRLAVRSSCCATARHVLDAFGQDRVLFGSDWPVCTLAASYAQVVEVAEEATSHLDKAGRAAVLGGNAVRVYRLKL